MRPSPLLLCWMLAGGAAAHDEPSEYQRITRALHLLKSPSSDAGTREECMATLLALGTDGPKRLAEHLERECETRHEQYLRAWPDLAEGFFQTARRLALKRIGRDEQRRIDEARAVVLGHAARAELTKEQIHDDSDPALATLEELLAITPGDVWDAAPDLFEDWSDLVVELERERDDHQWWTRARDALTADPKGERSLRRLTEPSDPTGLAEQAAAEIERLARLATPMPDRDLEILEANHALRDQVDEREADGVAVLNLMRVRLGLNALRLDVRLCRAGRDHSKDMNTLDFFSHTSPVEGKRTPSDRARLAGTSAGAENIAYGSSTADGVIRQWWYSPGHHKNMLGRHSRIGLGRFETHWTQMFG